MNATRRERSEDGGGQEAIRLLCVGSGNWLHLGGDGGLVPTAVFFSIADSANRHGINPWVSN